MIYALIIAFTILIAIVLLALTREKGLAAVSRGGISVRELASSLRNPDIVGVSPKIRRTGAKLRRGYKCVVKKVEKDEMLYEFERVLYENYYQVFSSVKRRDYKYFQALPHKFNKTRIEIIAEHMVADGLPITAERIEGAIRDFNSYTTLHIDEVTSLCQAIKLALYRSAAEMAADVARYRRMKIRAEKDARPSTAFARNSCYLYWRKLLGKSITPKELTRTDINIDNVEYEFSSRLIDYGKRMSDIVSTLKGLNNIFTMRFTLGLSDTHKLLLNDSVYAATDEGAQIAFLRLIEKYSFDYEVSERAVAEACMELQRKSGDCFMEFLMKRRLLKAELKGKPYGSVQELPIRLIEWLHIGAIYGATTVVSAILGALTMSAALGVPIALLSFIALLKPVEFVFMNAYRTVMHKRPTPRLDARSVAAERAVLVAVPHYISDEHELDEAIANIKTLRAGNCGENVGFALLIDFKCSAEPSPEYEKAWISKIERELSAYPDVNCFIRRKTKIGGSYGGRERKRGAIEEMNELLLTGRSACFSFVMREPKRYEYAIVLDADSRLLPGAVLQAVNTISHPLNAKYELMAFDNAYNAFTMRSLYSKQYYLASGHECYHAHGDYFYDLVGRAVFSGKGIYRIAAFNDKLKGALPENRVLSHDIIEGAIVDTGALGLSVFEDAPNTLMSDTDRRNRWLRGDTQLLEFVGGRIKNRDGKRVKRDIEPIYGYIMAGNFIKALGETALFALLLLALFVPRLFTFLPFIIGAGLIPLVQLSGYAFKGNKGMRLRYVFRAAAAKVTETAFAVLTLPFRAVNNLIVAVKSALSLALKRGLKWRTFSMSQRSLGFRAFLAMILPSELVLLALGLIGVTNPLVVAYTALSFAVTLALYPVNVEPDRCRTISDRDREELLGAARRTYGFFRAAGGESAIMPDNYQVKPYIGWAKNTSPTNIGLGMLAEVSACELGIIDLKTAEENIGKTLECLARLEKYRGHLYNWYDVKSLEVLPPRYVSCVDSGNLAAALIAVRQFLIKNKLRGADKAEELVEGMDFGALYDKENGLYRIGYNVDTEAYDGHYDMLASEARILYYVAGALKRDIAPWNNLSRDVTGVHGNTLASWSGTMFEYLMPSIFMKGSDYGLLERSNQGAVAAQKASKCNGLWGISECGYYKFDKSMKYQYYAFGLSTLAKRNECNRCVIAPYASILALEYAPRAVMQNIGLVRERGGMGELGYYESLDYTSGENVVRSHMAHHQGMIMAAIANYLTDGAIRGYFMADERMKSAEILLTERNLTKRVSRREKLDFVYEKRLENKDYEYSADGSGGYAALLNGGKYSVVLSSDGSGYASFGGRLINKYRYDGGMYGILPLFECGGRGVSPIRLIDESAKGVSFGVNEASYTGENCRMDVYVPHCLNGELREFVWLNHTDSEERVKVKLYMDLALNRYDDDVSHPAFSDMFIKTEYSKEYNAVIAERKPRENGGESTFAAFAVIGGAGTVFDTNKYNAVGRYGSVVSGERSEKLPPFGDSLYPCFYAEVTLEAHPNSLTAFNLVVFAESDKDALIERLKLTKDKNYVEFLKASARVMTLSDAKSYCLSPAEFKAAHRLAAHVLHTPYKERVEGCDFKALYESAGLRSDLKTLLVEYDNNVEYVSGIVRTAKYLNASGVNVNLLVVLKNAVVYGDTVLSALTDSVDDNIKFVYAPINEAYYRTAFMVLNGKEIPECARKKPQKRVKILNESGNISKNSQNISISGAISLKSGSGGYIGNSYYVLDKPLMPYSYVLAGGKGGTIVTEFGGGYTYYKNSREFKLTNWNNSPVDDKPSERIYLIYDNIAARINRLINGYVKYDDAAVYCNTVGGFKVDLSEYMLLDGAVKAYRVRIENAANEARSAELLFDADFAADWKASPNYNVYDIDEGVIGAVNILSGLGVYYTALGVFYTCDAVRTAGERTLEISEGYRCIRVFLKLEPRSILTETILLSMDKDAISSVKSSNIETLRKAERERIAELSLPRLSSSDGALDALYNRLIYQVSASRLSARAGYYQAGGAVGFRDQLQDSLALLYGDPARARGIILYCAARQFPEGDVLHWWHAPNKGVRTRISDDKLFLPFVVSEYVTATGDRSILEEEIPYLKGALLKEGEESAYADYEASELSETLLKHCKRAVDSALKYGEHGLLLIGAGDWNDALNAIGLQSRGESVWLTMFAFMTIERFIELLPSGERLEYLEVMEGLRIAVDKAFNGSWFKRAFTDDGRWLGDASSEVCKIDLLCQAFAVLSGAVSRKKAEAAVNSALELLVDREKRIIKLLDPPFDAAHYCGYISAYPAGVRENGGQYTHAAMWFLIALCRLKRYDEAYELFKMINPVDKCSDIGGNAAYMGEPYVLSGDVYASGQMGWSWYTGSAAWAFKLITEEFLGVRIKGEWLEINTPRISGLNGMRLNLRYFSSVYTLSFAKTERRRVTLDGVQYAGGRLPLRDDGREHDCRIGY